jgi:hypothetical protein
MIKKIQDKIPPVVGTSLGLLTAGTIMNTLRDTLYQLSFAQDKQLFLASVGCLDINRYV